MPPPSRTQGFRANGGAPRRLADALRGRYTIEDQIGAGGMAAVYAARDLKHDRRVAIKVLRGDLGVAGGGARFLAEIRTTANLQHPHILPLHDSGEAAGVVYYVMPLIEGASLRDRLEREGQLPIEDAVRIATEVADALHYAHTHGVIHRDVKPENILLQDGHALVADFGIATVPDRDESSRLTSASVNLGTPAYMSPEQASGERTLDARSDVHAIGSVLYEMLVGESPFLSDTMQGMFAKLFAEEPSPIAPRREDVPPHVEAAVLRALAKQRGDRFATAREFALALRDPNSSNPALNMQGLLPAGSGHRSSNPGAKTPPASNSGPSSAAAGNAVSGGNVARINPPLPPSNTDDLPSTDDAGAQVPALNNWGLSNPALRRPAALAAPVAPRTSRRTRLVLGLVAVLFGAVVGIWGLRRGMSPRAAAAPQATVLIGSVTNRTGDSTIDALLPELLSTSLEQSRTVGVYPRTNLPFVLRRMQRPAETTVDEAVGREIATREGLAAVILPSITKLGMNADASYVLVVSAVLPDGRKMASVRQTFPDLAQLPARIDSVGNDLRKAFGESAARISASKPLEEVTSKSLDAVRLYSQGREHLNAGDPRGAIPLLQRATELDSGFASAHGSLGIAYTNILDMVSATQHLRIAASFASRAPEAEREKILGDYAMSRRDFNAACPHFEVLTALRPRDYLAVFSLAWCSAQRLDFATAVAASNKGLALQDSPRTRIQHAMIAFFSGDLATAREDAHIARTQAPTAFQAWYAEAKAVLASGDVAGARDLYQQMVPQGGDMAIEGHNGLADVARYTGHLDEARTQLEAARSAALARGNVAVATSTAASLAELATEQGRANDFRALMATLDASSLPDPWLVYRIGRAWARAGHSAEASAAIHSIDSLRIGPSAQLDALTSLLRAEIALSSGQSDSAVAYADAAIRFEASTVAYETLARADLAAKRPDAAAAAFERVVHHPQERCESYDMPACYRVAEATYQLGRIKDDAGDHAAAAPLLQRFVTLWSGAKGQPMYDDAMRRLSARH